MLNTFTSVCANCSHVHPSSTTRGTTRFSAQCDAPGCNCTTFKLGHGGSKAVEAAVTENGIAAARENDALRAHVVDLRGQLQEAQASVTPMDLLEFDALKAEARQARADLIDAHTEHHSKLSAFRRHLDTLAATVGKIAPLAEALLTIVSAGHNPNAHEAILSAAKQINDSVQAARQIVDTIDSPA